ncbi:hypothetical protein DPMN_119161 [Dreissena polymorpha]|uniref:Uncharacterized protein n=1 Tax=Dreissena polymorpha TaxID=45954 RepID=A0A9D4GIQ7_DREPO|nr:hypothetical protein DPMN_119161 [Dreissena polymorpha]
MLAECEEDYYEQKNHLQNDVIVSCLKRFSPTPVQRYDWNQHCSIPAVITQPPRGDLTGTSINLSNLCRYNQPRDDSRIKW